MASGFPIVLANRPPDAAGLKEVAAAGVTMVRTGIAGWSASQLTAQIAAECAKLDAAHAAGLHCWLWLGALTDLPPGAPSPAERTLTRVVQDLGGHPRLGAWTGHDEPRNPLNTKLSIPPANLARGHRKVVALDGDHPLVIVQAPRGSVAGLVPYRPPCARYRRRGHLPGLLSARCALRSAEEGHRPRRRPDALDQADRRLKADLGDAADRVERRHPDPGQAGPRSPVPDRC